MQRLRHPIRAIREPFGKAGLTVAVIALVFAMVGGAFAAAGLNSKQKKEVKAIAKSFQGTGPAGTNGTNGTNGAPGEKGAKGDPGTNGTNGTNGVSVTSSPLGPSEGGCVEGGVEYTSASGTDVVCTGEEGAEGSPWTAGGTLPQGKTETGTWGAGGAMSETGAMVTAISIPIPTAAAPTPVYVTGASAAGCPGIVGGVPTADEGKLCIYQTSAFLASKSGVYKPSGNFMIAPVAGADPSGAIVIAVCENEAICGIGGVWAVKGS